MGLDPLGLAPGPLQSGALLRRAPAGSGPVAAPIVTATRCDAGIPASAESPFRRRHQPIPCCWIDHPYGEEEITLLKEEPMPVLSKLLRRIEEIDTEPEALHIAYVGLLQAMAQPTQPLLVSHP